MAVSRTWLWLCLSTGGGLLGLGTTLERVVHHGHAYAQAATAFLHGCVAGVTGALVGAFVGATLDAIDAAVARTAKGRTLAACVAAAAIAAIAYWAVIRISKYGQVLPLAVGLVLAASAAAAGAYAAARVAPLLLARRRALRWVVLLGVGLVAWIDLHAYSRSYGNVHLILSMTALLGAGSTVALFAPRPALLLRALTVAFPLALAGALLTPSSHAARNAVLQLGSLEKLVIQHVLWPALDGDGDGAASAPFGADCDDSDARNAPLTLPLRAPSLACAPLAAPPPPDRPAPAALAPKRDLIFIVVDTWRLDTPREPPAWTRAFTRMTRYRSCGSRTEQVLTQLLGDEGCPKAIPGDSLADYLRGAGYELVHMGEYSDITSRFPKTEPSASREALLARASAFFRERQSPRPLLALVHFKGGHATYDGVGENERARYDDAIARTVDAVGQLVPALPKDAVVVVAGDHGEEFGEHNGYTHALSLYEEVLRTQVLIRAPQLPAGSDARPLECVGLAELAAALVSDTPSTVSSAPASFAIVAAPKGVHGGLSETTSFSSVLPDGHKIIWQPRLDVFEVYDLASDPGEKHNLADAQPQQLRSQVSQLLARVQACSSALR